MKITYSAVGSVRGHCGHQHRTPAAAARCAMRDHRACQRGVGYSDRCLHRSDSERPTDDEHEEFDRAQVPDRYRSQ